MPTIRAVLFDLDDTLFDHAHAMSHALAALRADEPAFATWTTEYLEARHGEVLEVLHQEVLAGRLSIDEAREERFRRLLTMTESAALGRRRAVALARLYRETYKQGWRAVPGAIELLTWLKEAGYGTAVVTNNLTIEQRAKLAGCGLAPGVDHLITSEDVGVAKPDLVIFEDALTALGVTAPEAILVGDAWQADVVGGRAAGLRTVWLNRKGAPSPDPSVPELPSLEPLDRARAVLRL
jgi:HAD superfamily hydrolase (TIGR01509 family)